MSLGFVEGLNNKIRVIQRRAYGLRDEEYLREPGVGGHPLVIGRFCLEVGGHLPPDWPVLRRRGRWTPHWPVLPELAVPLASNRYAGGLQIGAGGLAANANLLLDPTDRPTKPAQGYNLLSLRFAQDVHPGGEPWLVRLVNILQRYNWPVFRCPSLAGFRCPPRVEILGQVPIHDIGVPFADRLVHRSDGVLGTAFGPISARAVHKVRLANERQSAAPTSV